MTTGANERIIKEDGHLVEYQKPEKWIYAVTAPFVNSGDLILDCFMGSGTGGTVASKLDCDYIGIEYDLEKFKLAKTRLENLDQNYNKKYTQLTLTQ